RGRVYQWPRNRSFGDGKPRPVVVIAPDAATRLGQQPPGLSAGALGCPPPFTPISWRDRWAASPQLIWRRLPRR
ncbi:MAG: hypothetical protein ACKOZW_14170, partial [Cyanobium sp.]